jgi:hypothetical protein
MRSIFRSSSNCRISASALSALARLGRLIRRTSAYFESAQASIATVLQSKADIGDK